MGELSLIVGLLLAGLSVYTIISNILSSDEEQKALSWASGDEPVKSKSGFLEFSRPLVHRFGLTFAQKIKNPDYRERVRKLIFTSGLSGELNTDEFIGLQMLWGVAFPIVLLTLNFALQLEFPIPMLLLMGAGGVYFPFLHCNQARALRKKQVIADLPFYIDLLALSTEAGMDFMGSIDRITQKAPAEAVLGQELRKVLQDLQLGSSRADALRKLSERLDIPEVTSFVTLLIDSEATGGSIGKALKSQAIQMRLERFTRAEKQGARISDLLMIPVVFLILPAILIIVLGPAILIFMGGGGQ